MKAAFRILCVLFTLSFQLKAWSQIPMLNSYPGATAVIYLDLDGHRVTGTSWNMMGMDLNCAPAGLNTAQINEAFNRVAEDYRPFNINVTTDSTVFLAAPLNRRVRAIITTTSSWTAPSYGGISFPGSFQWGDDTPCFVFSDRQYYNPKWVAEATSHEVGHTFGLFHQAVYNSSCTRTSEYNWGQGSGEIGWAPIMGAGYNQNFTLWHNGPNEYFCSAYQNDLAIITSAANGFGYRPDDNGNTFTTASQPVFANSMFNAFGVIEQNTDQDFFKFIMPANGRFQLDAVPYNVGSGNAGSDLDMQVTLYDDAHNQLSVYNPGALLNSVADTTLNAGTYYLAVEGKGNLYAPSYASLGSYSLQGKIEIGDAILPVNKIELRAAQNGDKHQLSWSIISDKKIAVQTLEVATDGRNFKELTTTDKDDRNYIYRPEREQFTQYRIAVTFVDGHRYYSNVATIQPGAASTRPRVLGNLIQGTTIFISSPAKYVYDVIDMHGKTISKGQLTIGINNITIAHTASGIYIVRITGDDQQWTDKLVKE